MRHFRKKISRSLISRKKKPCKKVPGKVIPTMKKYLSWCIMLEKNLTPLYVIVYHQRFEKKFLPKQNHPYRAKKSNGRPLTNLYL